MHAGSIPLSEAALRVYECAGAAAAFRAVTEAVCGDGPARRAWWTSEGREGSVPEGWHPGAAAAARAHAGAGVARMPVDGVPALVVALGDGLGGLVVAPVLDAEDQAGWARVRTALHAVAAGERTRREQEQERETLLQRAEESEALHVLGLAANRTLDPDEVLTLVARFARTLLGAHYVTVSTREDEHVRTMAAVGLRGNDPLLDDDPFARRVMEAGHPLTLGGEHGLPPGDFPFHAAEGLQGGIGVPLALFGDSFGALVVGYRRAYTPVPQDFRLAMTLAGHAAVAISNARLHRTLAERSDELAHALDELRLTSEAKERFFASMSHELRTPLNGILGYQSLVLDGIAGPLPDPARDFLGRANRAARTLLRIVDDVLDYAKIEAGRLELDVVPAAVRDLVDEAVGTVAPMATQKGLRLDGGGDDGRRVIETDPARVRQILVNLLSNAVKFTPAGGTVTVSARPLADAGGGDGGVEVRVRDTGPGIAPEDQQRIFQEFEQVRGTQGGTGLGLPVSRKLARLLGGDLLLESRPGEGSTFILRLPGEAPASVGAIVAG